MEVRAAMDCNWSAVDRERCCYIYLKYAISCNFFGQKSLEKTVEELMIAAPRALPHIPEEEIRQELRRIKQICDEYRIVECFPIEPLEGYTEQCKRAFIKALKTETGILWELGLKPLRQVLEGKWRYNWISEKKSSLLSDGECEYEVLSDDTEAFALCEDMDPDELEELLEQLSRRKSPRSNRPLTPRRRRK